MADVPIRPGECRIQLTSGQPDARCLETLGVNLGEFAFAEPVICDGLVYAAGDQTLVALTVADGTQEWTHELGREILADPAIVDGTVFVGSVNNQMYALNAADGSEQWQYETGNMVRSAPTVVDGVIYIGSAMAISTCSIRTRARSDGCS